MSLLRRCLDRAQASSGLALERSEARDAALRAALPHVPALGWSMAALRAGLRDLGGDPMDAIRLFPGGPVEAVEAWCDLADRDMAAAAAGLSITELRIPERIRRLLILRLEQAEPHRGAVRHAFGLFSLPWNAAAGLRATARTADAVWRVAGDTSTDLSRHTRRATLATIYTATLAYWLQDEAPGFAATRAFLDRRLAELARLQRRRRGRHPRPPQAQPAL
jgi:ubiquinone biosynthesis protein COQ9